VQAQGCWALRQTAISNAANQAKAGFAGAIEAVVAAICAHPGDAGVQHLFFDALGIITAIGSNKVKACAVGAIEAAVAALRTHLGSASVQEQGCLLLYDLIVDNDAYKAKASAAGAVEALVATLQAHPGMPEVQGLACALLINLTVCNAANLAKAASLGAIMGIASSAEAVVATMRALPDSKAVILQGSKALKNIMAESSAQVEVRNSVIQAVLKAALSKFPTGQVAKHTKAALAEMGEQPGAKKRRLDG
jgi:hypothetical protein